VRSGSEVVADIFRSTDLTGTAAPRVLLYAPRATRNPYQALLYSALWARGIAPIAAPTLPSLRHAEAAIAAGGSAAVHVHWTSTITAAATSADDHRLRSARFLTMLDELRSIGVTVLWTLHNVIEHDAEHRDAEVELRAGLAERADVVHVMSEHALDEVGGAYPIDPAKVAVVRHPAYIGAFPEFATSASSRLALGVSASDLVVGSFGALKPYKRLDELHAACRAASSTERRVRLLVAGEVSDGERVAAALNAVLADPWAFAVGGVLDDRALSELVSACDVVSCAYDSPLTSGVSMLAMSLSRPVILPDRPISRDVAGDAGIYVEPGNPAALLECLSRLDRDDLAERGRLARKAAESVRFEVVAEQFADLAEPLIRQIR